MKIAIITDQHFDVRSGSQYWLNRMEEFYSQTFFPVLDERNIKHLLILGDTFDNRTKVSVVGLHRTREMFFDELEKRGIEVTIILGNHDVAKRNTNLYNSIDIIAKAYKNIHLVYDRQTIYFDDTPINMISWVNKQNFQESLKFFEECPPTVLCGHFEIAGFQMTPGNINEHGFDPRTFQRFSKVFSGHFHTIGNDGRIMYISNPFQLNWSDYDLDKGFRIFDTKSYDLEFVKNPKTIFEKIQYTSYISPLDFNFQFYRNKIVRVYIESYIETNQAALSLFMQKLQAVVYSADIVQTNALQITSSGDLQKNLDNTVLIDKYIDQAISSQTIDKKLLKLMFKDLYDEALMTVDAE